MGSWTDTPFLVVDTESTGTDPAVARIVELGAAHVRGPVVTTYRRRCNPGEPIPAEASRIHGIRDEDVQDQPSFAQLAPRFLQLLAERGQVLAGYNALGYDVPLLNAELARAGFAERIDPAGVLDVILFVRWHLRHLRHRDLSAVCLYHGILLKDAHSAAADARATGQLLLRLVADGLLPADVDAALAEQQRIAPLLEEEWTRWTYWLYRDRRDGQRLRLGAGKHCGAFLDGVDPGYCSYIVQQADDLPDEVRTLFSARARGEAVQHA